MAFRPACVPETLMAGCVTGSRVCERHPSREGAMNTPTAPGLTRRTADSPPAGEETVEAGFRFRPLSEPAVILRRLF